ncbi:MAG: hypothetical protein ACI4DO_02725 [Roseburia sp.]
MNPMILGRGFAMGVAIPVITLVTGILSRIPVFTITGKRKAVSGMVTVVPFCLAIVVLLLFFVVLGCDPYEADIWWGILLLYGVCWLAFSALSCLVEDAKCILEKDGIRFRKAIGFSHKYTYDEIRKYAKVIRPFVCRDNFCIYLGDRQAVLPLKYSIGGRPLVKEFCKRLDLNYEEMIELSKVNWKIGANMYYLMEKMVKEEKKR